MKNLFESYFKKSLLMEDDSLSDELSDGLDTPYEDGDTENLANELDAESGVQEEDMATAQEANDLLKGKIETKIKEGNDQIAVWAEALEEFATFINDPTNEESIKHIIDNAGTGTALASVKSVAGKQMTKVATDCAVLAQTLRSLIGSVSVDDVLGLSK